MNTGQMGVAISTTGSEHRLGFLETCVRAWRAALPLADPIFVTVDGTAQDTQRVVERLAGIDCAIYMVGRKTDMSTFPFGRQGVAANKNTGLELLMNACHGYGYPSVEHLFLSDDDTWPLNPAALGLHTGMRDTVPHSMVMWGESRLVDAPGLYATWNWPRGVVLYTHRSIMHKVGGMDERFGLGGHEHADWSRRIFNAGHTPAMFCSPYFYSTDSYSYRRAYGAAHFWHAEDMIRPGEPRHAWQARKRTNTTIDPSTRDWDKIDRLYADNEHDTAFKSYRADANGRTAATLFAAGDLSGQGAGGESSE